MSKQTKQGARLGAALALALLTGCSAAARESSPATREQAAAGQTAGELTLPAFTDVRVDAVTTDVSFRYGSGYALHYELPEGELLEQAEARLSIMKRVCEEIRLRVENREHLSFEFVTLPQYVCFTGEFQGTTVENRYWAMYNLYHQAVERGYRLLATEPLFVINRRNDFIRGAFTEDVVNFTCCIPLEPDTAPEDAVVYPACRAFSCPLVTCSAFTCPLSSMRS